MPSQFADLIFTNGPVITVDARDSLAQAACVRGNKIIHVGDAAGGGCL